MLSNNKLAAIYDLRAATEAKVYAEVALEQQPSSVTRAALLDATLELEARTQTAIEVCHECGLPHASPEPHGAGGGNVIEVDFMGEGAGVNDR